MHAASLISRAGLGLGRRLASRLGFTGASCTSSVRTLPVARLGLRCLAAQAPLTNKERKARRAEAQRLGKSMCTLNIGKAGLTESFLNSLLDAQGANEYVKVRVGGGCDEGMGTLAEMLEAAADCVVVHSIGFTLTLYRDPALPRRTSAEAAAVLAAGGDPAAAATAAAAAPAPAAAAAAGPGSSAAAAAAGEESDEGGSLEDGLEEEEGEDSEDEEEAAEASSNFVIVKGVRMKKPPEFTIIG